MIINCLREDQCAKCRCSCGGGGTLYYSDDVYGPCVFCCCLNCRKYKDECKCKYCEQCGDTLYNSLHKCYLCDKCGKYVRYEILLNDHCKECCNCKK